MAVVTFAYGETVVISPHSPSSEDAHGNATDSWGAGVEVPGCAVYLAAPASAEPFQAGRSLVITTPTVYAPPGTAVSPHDRVTVRGMQYEVIGDPDDVVQPFTGWRPGVVIALRRVEG